MGCLESLMGGSSEGGDSSIPFSSTWEGMSIDGIDTNSPGQNPVYDFPFYMMRLQPIDWQGAAGSSELFCDPNFPADQSSILDPILPRDGKEAWSNFVWMRPSEVYGEGNFKLYETVDPMDVKQGKCGDCYFLASLSSLAENGDRIKNIFLQNETNAAGCYAVDFYICGEKRTVVVDDRFPYDQSRNEWAFSRPSTSNEIWVLILEKAWAKVYGNYQRIEAGTTDEALHPLVGCPVQNFEHKKTKNKDGLWETILFADQQNFPMCTAVSSQAGSSSSGIKDAGLVDGHAYSLISAKVVQKESGDTVRLCLIRNPWGKKEWTGAWSDSSPLWDDFTKQQVPQHSVTNDGCFWICYEDYLKFFYLTSVCFYKDGYQNLQGCQVTETVQQGQFAFCKLILNQDTVAPLVVTVDQLNQRFTESDNSTHPPTKLIVTKVVDKPDVAFGEGQKSILFLDGTYTGGNSTTNVSFREGLQAGEYLIFYTVEFADSVPQKKTTLSIYCQEQVQLTRLNPQNFGFEKFRELDRPLAERMKRPEQSVKMF